MSNIQQKLKENKDKIKREKLLSALDSGFSEFIANAEYSSEAYCMKYAAFPIWDEATKRPAPARGNVKNWNCFSFRTWNELIAVLKKFQKVKNFIGWFFTEKDGPYYRISLNAFLSHIQSISEYAMNNEHYNFGWVGEADDVGMIIEKNPAPPGDKTFSIAIWGL